MLIEKLRLEMEAARHCFLGFEKLHELAMLLKDTGMGEQWIHEFLMEIMNGKIYDREYLEDYFSNENDPVWKKILDYSKKITSHQASYI